MIAPLLLLRKEAHGLVFLAQTRLGLSQEQLGDALRTSKRTVSRWASGRSSPSIAQVRTLAALVHPRDPALAAQLASATGDTLETLGIVPPPPPPAPPPVALPPPPPPPLPTALVVQAVVCAAADALHAPPSTVRPALLAAFRMARELRLGVQDVEIALADPPPEAPSILKDA